MSTNEMSPALQQAYALFQQGQSLQAEDCLRAAAQQAAAQYGGGSAEFAASQYELAALLQVMGRDDDAIETMRRACAVNIPDDTQATRDRLTYLMQLGEMLERSGELAEAEHVLRDGLVAREAFYGREHPGYAFGLEPLASVVLHQGNPETALEIIEEVIDNFWRAGHPRVATAFPLRAKILKALQSPTPPFEGLDELPEEFLSDMATAAVNDVDWERPGIGQAVLTDLLPLIERRMGPQHQATLQIQSVLANLGRELGGHEGRIETIEKVLAAHEVRGEHAQAIQARYGLALALSDAGNHDAAREAYTHGIHQASQLGDDRLRAMGLRNLGLMHSELKQKQEAEQTLQLAVQVSQQSGDTELFGRSLTALGIYLQHEGNLAQAEPLLVQAIQQLDAAHPDCLCARSHLQAIRENASCGCGDMSGALAEAFRAFVLDRMPAGLLEDFNVTLEDNDFQVQVDLAREPSQEELDLIQRIVRQAEIEFRKRISETH